MYVLHQLVHIAQISSTADHPSTYRHLLMGFVILRAEVVWGVWHFAVGIRGYVTCVFVDLV
jgi:hypothetical protein